MAAMFNTYSTMLRPGESFELPEKKDACGWKCQGCHATNAADEERCSYCRSYRLAEKAEVLPKHKQSSETQAQFLAHMELLGNIFDSFYPQIEASKK